MPAKSKPTTAKRSTTAKPPATRGVEAAAKRSGGTGTGSRRKTAASQSPATKTIERPRGQSGALLLAAASRLLSQRNSGDVSLSEIAQESGLNSALISYHFGNKEGLLLALLNRDAELVLSELDKLLTAKMTAEQKIRLHIRGVIETYSRYPYMNRLIHHLLEGDNQVVAKSISGFFIEPLVAAQQKIIAEGVAAGVMRPVEPMYFYYTVIGACDLIFYGRASLENTFGVAKLTPDIRNAYAEFVAEAALRMLRL